MTSRKYQYHVTFDLDLEQPGYRPPAELGTTTTRNWCKLSPIHTADADATQQGRSDGGGYRDLTPPHPKKKSAKVNFMG